MGLGPGLGVGLDGAGVGPSWRSNDWAMGPIGSGVGFAGAGRSTPCWLAVGTANTRPPRTTRLG